MLFVLAVICPPLAVLLTRRPAQAATNVGLTALLYVPGVIHALHAVDRYHTERWSSALMRAVERTEAVSVAA